MRYYHVMCRRCEWHKFNLSEEQAEELGICHYYEMPEDGHTIKWFDTTTRYADG